MLPFGCKLPSFDASPPEAPLCPWPSDDGGAEKAAVSGNAAILRIEGALMLGSEVT